MKCSTVGCDKSCLGVDLIFCPNCRRGWVKHCKDLGISFMDMFSEVEMISVLGHFQYRFLHNIYL